MSPLVNKRVVVIGASQGIGFAVSKACLVEGAQLTIVSSNEMKLQSAAERLGGIGDKLKFETVNVTDESAVKALFERIGEFDHLVYTAVSSMAEGFPHRNLNNLKGAFDVFYWGMLSCAKHSQGYVIESITTTSGTTGLKPVSGMTVSSGQAGAAISSTRGLALDFAPVRVNCVAPGLVDTKLWYGVDPTIQDVVFTRARERSPVGHVGTPEEVAEAYLFLMKCSYMTGQTICPDGGAMLLS